MQQIATIDLPFLIEMIKSIKEGNVELAIEGNAFQMIGVSRSAAMNHGRESVLEMQLPEGQKVASAL
jgi:hypothetical protein